MQTAEQRRPHHPVVGARILGRHAALVAEPHGRRAPLDWVGRCSLVRRSRRRSPGEHELSARARGREQQLGADGGRIGQHP